MTQLALPPTPIADQLVYEAYASTRGRPAYERLLALADRVRTLEIAYAGNKKRLRDAEDALAGSAHRRIF